MTRSLFLWIIGVLGVHNITAELENVTLFLSVPNTQTPIIYDLGCRKVSDLCHNIVVGIFYCSLSSWD